MAIGHTGVEEKDIAQVQADAAHLTDYAVHHVLKA
jgi:hypothetical protein